MINKEELLEKLEERRKKINELINKRNSMELLLNKIENEIVRTEGETTILTELIDNFENKNKEKEIK